MTEVDHSQDQALAGHVGHDEHGGHGHGDHVAAFRRLFWVMLVLAVPTVAASPMFGMILGYTLPEFSACSGCPPCWAR
jgi:Cu2+-exporting ATPase